MKKKESAEPAAPTGYLVLVPLNYGFPEQRAEVGETLFDLPETAISWLLEQRCIQSVEEQTNGETRT